MIRKFDASANREAATMQRVHAIGIDESRQVGGTANAADDADLMRLETQLKKRGLQRGEHGEVAATGAPIRMDFSFVSVLVELARRSLFRRFWWCDFNGRVHKIIYN
jgi:hypothetical protein